MTSNPNILFILTDQQRKDTLSAYGDLACKTPNLDELANQSTIFDSAYASSPICAPAQATLQTGLYPMNHGVVTNFYNPNNDTSPDLLSRKLTEAG